MVQFIIVSLIVLLVTVTMTMVGVSGGSFLVPLMVLACYVPMHVAVGTASTLIAAIALMGFKKLNIIKTVLGLLLLTAHVSVAGTLNFDGEIRERFEAMDGMNQKAYGDSAVDAKGNIRGKSDDRLLLQRIIAGFTYQQKKNITYHLHMYDARVRGWSLDNDDFIKNRGTPDEYVMNPNEEFFELYDANVQLVDLWVEGVTATIGRQKIWYGDKRIFGPGSWGNSIGWLWDAARVSYEKEGNFIDGWYGRTKTKDPHSFSLFHKHAYQGVGLYTHHKTTENGAFEPFFAWKNNLLHETVPEDNLYYYGFRLYEKDYHGINYDFTFSMENGNSSTKSVNAYAYAAKVGYTFKNILTQPNIVVGRIFASGDSNPGDNTLKTFTRPFGSTGGTHYGRMDIMNWSNMEDNQIYLHIYPCKKANVIISFHNFNLTKSEDKWAYYGYSNAPGNNDTHIGNEYDFQMKYNFSKKIDFQFIYAYFNAGVFVKNNVEDNDAQRLFIQGTYKFDIRL